MIVSRGGFDNLLTYTIHNTLCCGVCFFFWIIESTIVFKSGLNTYTVLPSAYGSKATKPFMHALLNRLSCQSSWNSESQCWKPFCVLVLKRPPKAGLKALSSITNYNLEWRSEVPHKNYRNEKILPAVPAPRNEVLSARIKALEKLLGWI